MTDQVLSVLFVVFLLTKMPVTYFVSKRKNKLEKSFNYFITILFGLIEFLTLFSMFKDTQQWILLFSIFTISIESFIKEKSNSRAILTGTFLIFFVISLSIVLFFINPSESALVSAITAVATLLLTTDTLEDVFNIKVTKQRQKQLSVIKISVLFLVPIIYASSLIYPRPDNNTSIYTMLLTGIYRFIVLEITYPLFLFLIYFKKLRQKIQIMLGLPSSQKYLYGNWNMITINKFTNQDIIVRKFLLNIDGNRIKFLGSFFTFDEDNVIYNDKEEILGKIEKCNDDRVNLVIDNKTIQLIKIGSDEYRKFSSCYYNRKEKFYNIQFTEPITNSNLEVTLFLFNNVENQFIEINSMTNYKYDLIDGEFIRINNNNEKFVMNNFLPSDLYESDEFK
jgi:membrane protein